MSNKQNRKNIYVCDEQPGISRTNLRQSRYHEVIRVNHKPDVELDIMLGKEEMIRVKVLDDAVEIEFWNTVDLD